MTPDVDGEEARQRRRFRRLVPGLVGDGFGKSAVVSEQDGGSEKVDENGACHREREGRGESVRMVKVGEMWRPKVDETSAKEERPFRRTHSLYRR